jgi:hypothetical protein
MDTTKGELNKLFEYKSDGSLVRRVSVSPNTKAGDIAGGPNATGHLQVRINWKLEYVHRVVWVMAKGAILEVC